MTARVTLTRPSTVFSMLKNNFMTLKDYLNENDRYAANAGVRLLYVGEGRATAVMTVTGSHLNGGGVCQGGALFTLADLAMAAVLNSHGSLTLSIESTISFMRSAVEGDVLTAEAVETYNHRKIPFCEVTVRNDRGEIICKMSGMAYRKDKSMPVDGLM